MMYTVDALLDLHERAHRNLRDLLTHCTVLDAESLNRELPGFGYPCVRLQLHHLLGAERYWVGVLQGQMIVDDDDAEFATAAQLEALRQRVFENTEHYLRGTSLEELNQAQPLITWGGHERSLVPARVILRTVTHLYHHIGQVVAMCRLLGAPTPSLDFPLG
jgi:uncharacterized damage-inducible protein DinB